MTQESENWESRAWGLWGGRDRTHVWTCVDVSVCVLVPQLGSGKGAEPGSEGQEELGACLVLRGKLGPEGIMGHADRYICIPGSGRAPRVG